MEISETEKLARKIISVEIISYKLTNKHLNQLLDGISGMQSMTQK